MEAVLIDSEKLIEVANKDFFKKSKYDTHKQGIDEKIENVENKYQMLTDLVTNTVVNTKIGEVEKKLLMMLNLRYMLAVSRCEKIQFQIISCSLDTWHITRIELFGNYEK